MAWGGLCRAGEGHQRGRHGGGGGRRVAWGSQPARAPGHVYCQRRRVGVVLVRSRLEYDALHQALTVEEEDG